METDCLIVVCNWLVSLCVERLLCRRRARHIHHGNANGIRALERDHANQCHAIALTISHSGATGHFEPDRDGDRGTQ